jgi:hypothetical protein
MLPGVAAHHRAARGGQQPEPAPPTPAATVEGLKREFGRLLESELATGWHERQHTLAAVRLRGLRDRLVALTTDLAAAATAEQDGEAAAAAAGLQRAKSGGGGGLEARLACEDVLCLAEDGLAQLLAELEADPGLRAAREAYTKSMRREHQLLTARVARVIRKDTEAEGRQAVADAQRRLARARASGLECGHMTVLQLGAELKERESGLRSQIAEARCGAPAAVSASRCARLHGHGLGWAGFVHLCGACSCREVKEAPGAVQVCGGRCAGAGGRRRRGAESSHLRADGRGGGGGAARAAAAGSGEGAGGRGAEHAGGRARREGAAGEPAPPDPAHAGAVRAHSAAVASAAPDIPP